MMKKLLRKMLGLPAKIYNRLIFVHRRPVYQEFPEINGRIYLVGDRGSISFGNRVRINSSMKSNPIGGNTRTILFAEQGAKISIGNNVGISNAVIHTAKSVMIGNDVLIGGSCKIYDTDFHWVDYEKRIKQSGGGTAPIKIKDGAFIGGHCIILKGVTIGKHSVIGAGSVVTKDVPDYELWAGNPARFIKKVD